MPHVQFTESDSQLLDILTGPNPAAVKAAIPRRDAALDPLMLACAAASGPHVTRNHYAHDFFPGVMAPTAEGSFDWTKWKGGDASAPAQRLRYVSRQGPRRVRLAKEGAENCQTPKDEIIPQTTNDSQKDSAQTTQGTSKSSVALNNQPSSALPPVEVKCMARTRIPTPHGPAFLHLYHNNRDSKEHLAIVVDSAQFSEQTATFAPPIRSQSLDAKWSEDETEMDRITRGAFVGKLSPTSQVASTPSTSTSRHSQNVNDIPAPIIRLHSECFTGETIGSMRCDCGEQLDEAIRVISQPVPVSRHPNGNTTIPGRGAVIYLRQEGRGIGLLSKIRAYNLQDLGHDTVTANLMLGHKADERGYEIAGAILRDLELDTQGVRVLTNNPDKVQALEGENVNVIERVPMIPRSWQCRQKQSHSNAQKPAAKESPEDLLTRLQKEQKNKLAGATLIGGGAVYGEDLDKYLRTKVLRMGHMLPLWLEDSP